MTKRQRTVAISVAGVFVLLLVAALFVPMLFKDRIEALAKARLNERLNATVDWRSVSLSILRGFPDATVTAHQMTICNLAPFDGICLAEIDQASVRIGLGSLFGDTIDVKSVGFTQPRVRLVVNEHGVGNWHITRASDEVAAPQDRSNIHVALREYWIERGQLTYEDASGGMGFQIAGLDHRGRGDFTRDRVALDTVTHADGVTVSTAGVPSLKDAVVDIDAELDIDMPAKKVTLKDNEFKVNELALRVDGWVAQQGERLAMDVSWRATKSDLATLLSLVPAGLAGDLRGIETTGTVALDGHAKGAYGDDAVPALGVRITVRDGSFKYPSLPKRAERIEIDAEIAGPEAKDFDAVVVDVRRFTARFAGHPVDARARLATLVSDPAIDGDVRADVDLTDLAAVVPFPEGTALSGRAVADVRLRGQLSALERQQYDRFAASGSVNVRNLAYAGAAFSGRLLGDAVNLTFSPRYVELVADGLRVGGSDLDVKGRLENYLVWWMKHGVLRGTMDVTSNTLLVNELMGSRGEPGSAAAEGAPAKSKAIAIPANVDLTLNAAAEKVVYDGFELGGMRGRLRLHDRRADLQDLTFGLFGGRLTMNGSYDTRDERRPAVSLGYDARLIDIQQAVRQVETLSRIAPIAAASIGRINSTLQIAARLDEFMTPDVSTLDGRGTLNAAEIRLDRFAPMVSFARALKLGGDLESPTLRDVRFGFVFRDGRMITSPFDVAVDRMQLRVGGSTAFADRRIDYDITAKVPTAMFGAAAADRVAEWLGRANAALDGSIPVPESLGVTARMVGTVTDPSLRLAFDDGGTANAVRAAAVGKARAEAERLLEEAERQGQEIKEEAARAAERLRVEAAEAGARLIEQAANPIARVAAQVTAEQLRNQADRRARRIESEAGARADALVGAAREKGNALVGAAMPAP